MAIAYSYPKEIQLSLEDMLVGTATAEVNGRKRLITKNFTLQSLGQFIAANFPDVGITLTTIGTSGLATLVGSTLNIPNYSAFSNPTLQSVTDAGNETGNSIKSLGGAGYTTMDGEKVYTTDLGLDSWSILHSGGYLALKNPDAIYESYLTNSNVTDDNVILEFPDKPSGTYTIATTSDLSTGYVPYTGATANVDLGNNDLLVNEIFLYDGPNDNYGSVHYTDGNFHIEDGDGHPLLVIEDEFIQLHKSATIQSNLWTSGLSATRDHYLPNQSGTIALTSDIPSLLQVTPVTLTAASWSLVSGLYEYVYSNVNILSTSIVNVIPSNSTIAIVQAASILPSTESASGSVKLFATNLPTADIIVTFNIFN